MLERFVLISPYIFVLGTFIIGLITPGYNHLSRTVSRLMIEQYGYLEAINMLQLVIALLLTGAVLAPRIRSSHAAFIVRISMYVSALVAFILAIVPTDPVDNMRLSEVTFTLAAKVHIGLVMAFILLTPVGIDKLFRTFLDDKDLRPLAYSTLGLGYGAFALSIVWFVFFYYGILIEYRGLFQKIIILPVIWWLILLTRKLVSLKT